MTLAWRLDNPDPSLAAAVEFQLTAPGYSWMGMARSWDGTMLEGVGMAGSGPAVIAMPDSAQEPNGFYVNQFRLTARTAIGAVQTAHYTLLSAWARYDPGTDSSILSFARPLVPPDFADPSEKSIIPTRPQTFIAACGTPGLPFGPHGPNNRLNFSLQLVPRRCSRSADCSGHGACRGGADAPACFCDVGWAGASCSSCASGFYPSGIATSSGSGAIMAPAACLPSDDSYVIARLKANVRFVLAIDFSAVVGPAGTLKNSRSAWALADDLAVSLGIPNGRIRVVSLAALTSPLPGSYQQIVPPYTAASVDILPPLRPPPAAPAPPLSAASAGAVAAQLARLAANPASVLFSGQFTQALSIAAQPLAFSFGAISPGEAGSGSAAIPAYSFAVSVPRVNLTMEWVVNGTAGTANFRVTRARASGSTPSWIAIAFNDDASVVGADAVVFEAAPDAGALTQFVIAEHSLSGMLAVPPSLNGATLLSGQASGGSGGNITAFEWMRPLRAGAYAGAQALPLTSPVCILFAIGSGPLLTGSGGSHSGALTGGFSATLSTGRVGPLPTPAAPTPSPSPSPGAAAIAAQEASAASAHAAHGALMFLAYGVLAPLGILLSVRMRGGRHEEAPHGTSHSDLVDDGEAVGSAYRVPTGIGGPRKSSSKSAGLARTLLRSATGCCSTCTCARSSPTTASGARLAPCWLRVHAALMTSAALVSTIAFIIALAMVPAVARMSTAHHVIGLLLWLLTVAQACAGVCRPAPAAVSAGAAANAWRRRWYAAHRTCGWIILSAGVLQTYLGLAAARANPVLFVLYSLLLAAVLLLSLKDHIVACGAVSRCAACPAACRTFCCGEGDIDEEGVEYELDEEAQQAELHADDTSGSAAGKHPADLDAAVPHTVIVADHAAAGGIAAAMAAASAAAAEGAQAGSVSARRQDRVSLIAAAVLGHGDAAAASAGAAAAKPRRAVLSDSGGDGSESGFGLELPPLGTSSAPSNAGVRPTRGSTAAGATAYGPVSTSGAVAATGARSGISAASRQLRAGARTSVTQSGSDGRFAPLRAAGGAGRRGKGSGGAGAARGSRTGPGGLIAPRAGALDAGDLAADEERWEDDDDADYGYDDDGYADGHNGAHYDGDEYRGPTAAASALGAPATGRADVRLSVPDRSAAHVGGRHDDEIDEAWGEDDFADMAEGENEDTADRDDGDDGGNKGDNPLHAAAESGRPR